MAASCALGFVLLHLKLCFTENYFLGSFFFISIS